MNKCIGNETIFFSVISRYSFVLCLVLAYWRHWSRCTFTQIFIHYELYSLQITFDFLLFCCFPLLLLFAQGQPRQMHFFYVFIFHHNFLTGVSVYSFSFHLDEQITVMSRSQINVLWKRIFVQKEKTENNKIILCV